FLAIMGDASDNIPGVEGIGEKGAQKLLSDFKSLEEIYNNINSIPEKVREKLIEGKDSAFRSREIVKLKTDLPIEFDPEKFRIREMKKGKLIELLRKLEFHSLLKEFGGEELKKGKGKYEVVESIEKLKELVKRIKDKGYFALDTETDSLSPIDANLVGISIAIDEGSGYYIPVGHKLNDSLVRQKYNNLDLNEIIKILGELIENEEIMKIGQNAKYDILVLRNYGIELKNCGFDTMIASYLIDPGSHQHGLDYIALRYLNYKMTTYKEVTKRGKKEIPFGELPIEVACEYSAEDADITLRLKNFFEPKLNDYGLKEVFEKVEMPLMYVLADMEYAGVKLERAMLEDFAKEVRKRMEVCANEIYELAGERFNINSPAQLQKILFEKLNLPSAKKTKTGKSTDVDVLEKLAEHHPLPKKILEYRSYSKLISTYIESLIGLINP
ncbi:MAG: DNA polymerase, partial [bacterium]